MTTNFAKNILLTGAGFTKNFGGLLASEMWSKVFNHQQIKNNLNLRELLLNDYDYESIYYKVLSGKFSIQEKEAITVAILKAYEIIDDIAREWTFTVGSPYPVNIYGVNKFIEKFAGRNNEVGFFFTLNQDLFMERHWTIIDAVLASPGVRRVPDSHKLIMRLPLTKEDYISLPTQNEILNIVLKPLLNKTLYYIKLHGSFGWKSSDGSNKLVIGKNKESQIVEEPLLS